MMTIFHRLIKSFSFGLGQYHLIMNVYKVTDKSLSDAERLVVNSREVEFGELTPADIATAVGSVKPTLNYQ